MFYQNELIFSPFSLFQKKLNHEFGFLFDFDHFSKKPIYNALEYSIASFGLEAGVDAHLSAFLENVFEFKTNNNSDFTSYLDYWEKKGRHQRIVIPQGIKTP